MTATSKAFRALLADRALSASTIVEARDIVQRAHQAAERAKSEIAGATAAAPFYRIARAATTGQSLSARK